MIKYEVGKFYNFHIVGVHNTYISLKDDEGESFTVSAFPFQSDWDYRFAPDAIMSCYVKDVRKDGFVFLQQNRLNVLQSCYKEFPNRTTVFVVNKVYEFKDNPKEKRLLLEDAFGILHLYAPQKYEEHTAQAGDYINLYVCGITQHQNNLSNLILSHTYTQPSVSVQEVEKIKEDETTTDNTPIGANQEKTPEVENNQSDFVYLNLGDENQHLELKKTIIYTAGNINPDIDAQMGIILKTIAGFMNADGGVLYIGVNDEGYATGIEDDFKYLNTSRKDTNTYKEDKDGFENKICCSVRYFLSSGAELCLMKGNISGISFQKYNGHTVCKIEVQKSKDLIWAFKYELYMRLGNHTRRMAEREIERVILEHRTNNTAAKPNVEQISKADIDNTIQQPVSTISDVEKPEETPATVKTSVQPTREGRGSFYMNFFKDHTWSYSKDIPSDADLLKCIPINVPIRQQQLLMVYADGCVNKVNPAQIKTFYQKEDNRYANGRRSGNVEMMGMYTVSESDHVACIFEYQGHVFAKVHKVKDIRTHNAQNGLSLQGNMLLSSNYIGVKILALQPISHEAAKRVVSLWKTENQLSNSLGIQTDLPRYAHLDDEVKTLMAYCGLSKQ